MLCPNLLLGSTPGFLPSCIIPPNRPEASKSTVSGVEFAERQFPNNHAFRCCNYTFTKPFKISKRKKNEKDHRLRINGVLKNQKWGHQTFRQTVPRILK